MVREMDGSARISSSPRPLKVSSAPKASRSGFEETDENDKANQTLGSELQSSEKITLKNFLSPTISAAFKGVTPRKKTLGERNEASESISFGIHTRRTPKSANSNEGIDFPSDNSSSRASGFDDYETKASNDELSSQPYDPFRNYLSPRPKFLKYKPCRHREILLRCKKEADEGYDDGSSVSRSVGFDSVKSSEDEELDGSDSSPASPTSREGSVKQQDGYIDEDDEEIEEEERCFSLKGLFKFMFVLAVLFFTTFCISSTNIPQPVEDLWGGNGNLEIENLTFGQTLLDTRPITGFYFMEMDDRAKGDIVEEKKSVMLDKGEELELQEAELKMMEMVGHVIKAPNVDKWGSFPVMEKGESDRTCDGKLEEEASAQMAENAEQEMIEIAEEFEGLQDSEKPLTSAWAHDHANTSLNSSGEKINIDLLSEDEQANIDETSEMNHGESEMGKGGTEDTERSTEKDDEIMILNEDLKSEIVIPDREVLEELSETEIIPKAVKGISLLITTLVTLVVGLHFKCKRSSPAECSVRVDTCDEQGKKNSTENTNDGVKITEKDDSFGSPSSQIHPTKEISEDSYSKRAPTVELLGEFEVGEVSSFVDGGGQNETVKTKEVVRSSFASQDQSSHGEARSSLLKAEMSVMVSPSYGSFTSERSIKKKLEGKDGERSAAVTTPVRRSNRIRNKAAMSP